MTNQFLLQAHYVASDAEGKMGAEIRNLPTIDAISDMRLDRKALRWYPDRLDVGFFFLTLAMRLGAFYLPVTAILGFGIITPFFCLLDRYVPATPPSICVFVAVCLASWSWGVWVPCVVLSRIPFSYICLASAGEERASVAELFAVKRIREEIDRKKKQVEVLMQQLSAARRVEGSLCCPKELDDVAPILRGKEQKRKNTAQQQVDALLVEIRQLATRSQDLVRLVWACGILMEELKVAGLGGSYMELPHEDPLPFMERFIADGMAKLKAKYELDAMDEPQEAQNG